MSLYKQLTDMNDDVLIQIIQTSSSVSEILRKVGFGGQDPRARKWVLKYIEKHSISTDHFTKRSGKAAARRKYTVDDLIAAVKQSICVTDVLNHLGLSVVGGNSATIKRAIVDNNIDTSHFDVALARQRGRKVGYTLEEALIEDSPANRSSVKRLIQKHQLLKQCCSVCGIDSWLGNKIVLELDHINGISSDNRIENLRLLCPNCHSQTDTFRGRNNKHNYSGLAERSIATVC